MSFYSARKKKGAAASGAAPKKWQLAQQIDTNNDDDDRTTSSSSSSSSAARPLTAGSATGKRKASTMSETKNGTNDNGSSGSDITDFICRACRGEREPVLYCNDCDTYMCREDFIASHTPPTPSSLSSAAATTGTNIGDSGMSVHKIRALPGEDLSSLEVGWLSTESESQRAQKRRKDDAAEAEIRAQKDTEAIQSAATSGFGLGESSSGGMSRWSDDEDGDDNDAKESSSSSGGGIPTLASTTTSTTDRKQTIDNKDDDNNKKKNKGRYDDDDNDENGDDEEIIGKAEMQRREIARQKAKEAKDREMGIEPEPEPVDEGQDDGSGGDDDDDIVGEKKKKKKNKKPKRKEQR
jgi:hypothetical protein